MAYLLDTNVAIHLRERNPAILDRYDLLTEQAFISVATRVELEGGVYARPEWRDRRREAVDALLEFLPSIDFDKKMASAYGAIVATSGFSRRKIIDRMIAATALVSGMALVTTNPTDFTDIAGLELEIWKP